MTIASPASPNGFATRRSLPGYGCSTGARAADPRFLWLAALIELRRERAADCSSSHPRCDSLRSVPAKLGMGSTAAVPPSPSAAAKRMAKHGSNNAEEVEPRRSWPFCLLLND